jgi:hypothetical protein
MIARQMKSGSWISLEKIITDCDIANLVVEMAFLCTQRVQ